MKRLLLSLVAAVAVTGLVINDASADGFGGFRGPGFGRGFRGIGGFGTSTVRVGPSNIYDLYLSGQTPIPPYFALNPPVYYSYPVPRTYGYSPFAYPGWVKTPDIIHDVQPLEIMNPYVPSSTTTPTPAPAVDESVKAAPKSVEPLMVENPFYKGGDDIYTVSH